MEYLHGPFLLIQFIVLVIYIIIIKCAEFLVRCLQQVGKEFDALIIDTKAPLGDPVFDTFDSDTIEVSFLSTFALN